MERYEHERDERWPDRVTPVLCAHCHRMYQPEDRAECPARLRVALDAAEAREAPPT